MPVKRARVIVTKQRRSSPRTPKAKRPTPTPTETPSLSLPSLHGLHVFEVAARHASFTRAARELCVSQTAVSHQIKALEEELGSALFRRTKGGIELTPAGRSWALELADLFARLRSLNRRLRAPRDTRNHEIAISIMPSFGRWLVPRLGKFLDRHPEIEVRVSASEHLVDFASEQFDLGIRYGYGRYPGLFTEKISEDAWVVVCAPHLAARLKNLRDLERQVLLHDDSVEAWPRWLQANGHSGSLKARRTELTDSSMVIEAALRGQGVGIARWSLALDELGTGRLVLPFPKASALPTGRAYYLAAPRESLRRREVTTFLDWLRSEADSLRSGWP